VSKNPEEKLRTREQCRKFVLYLRVNRRITIARPIHVYRWHLEPLPFSTKEKWWLRSIINWGSWETLGCLVLDHKENAEITPKVFACLFLFLRQCLAMNPRLPSVSQSSYFCSQVLDLQAWATMFSSKKLFDESSYQHFFLSLYCIF
jgi:hypothetical protein